MIKKILIASVSICFFACSYKQSISKKTPVKNMTTTTFKKAGWIHNTNVYEVNLRQYTKEGTLNAFAKELPRLKEMGVEVLWFMPLTPISQQNKKGSLGSYYACSDYTAVNSEFGNLDDVKNLVRTAHGMGFKVIIDWVANHTGWDHVWTKSHPGYYEKDTITGTFKIASGMDDIIELDFTNTELRKAMISAMKFWVTECDIDGFRCDLAFWVELDFWLEARAELEKIKTLFWLAENDPLEHPEYGKAFDAAYTWSWMHKTEEFYKKDPDIKILDSVLLKYDATAKNGSGINLWFTTNHDENSWNGTEYEKYGDMALALAVFSFTWDGIPLIYGGQELPNKKRLQFFEKDPIEWNGKYELDNFYKTLNNLRKTNKALSAGDNDVSTYRLRIDADKNVLAYVRKNGGDEVLVLLNLSKDVARFEIQNNIISGKYVNVFDKSNNDFTDSKLFDMQPWEYRVYEKR
ncbi:MAG: alpha amylase C-terminal domain-containing protein [Chitinophagaceae bacterium]|nr:alpha amylase C-terminal domain-containing protein [Chitinophagaceae bacterium]